MEDKSLIGFVAKSYDKNLFTYNLFSYAIFRLLKIVLALKWLFFCGLPSGRPGLEVWLSGEIIYHITWLTNHAWRLQPSWTVVQKLHRMLRSRSTASLRARVRTLRNYKLGGKKDWRYPSLYFIPWKSIVQANREETQISSGGWCFWVCQLCCVI